MSYSDIQMITTMITFVDYEHNYKGYQFGYETISGEVGSYSVNYNNVKVIKDDFSITIYVGALDSIMDNPADKIDEIIDKMKMGMTLEMIKAYYEL